MPLIECIDLSKDWAGSRVFTKISFSLEPGQKIGLVGRNGCGKTSLLRILAGLDDDYHGVLRREASSLCALVPQRYEPPLSLSCIEVLMAPVLALRAELRHQEEAFASEGPESDERGRELALRAYGELSSRHERLGGEGAEEAARRLLSRTGLGKVADAPASALSGGEKNVLALALALLESPELLLLDEPGNHLDFAGLSWLEDFVRGERRSILMVSHNRHLLDRCVDRTFELEGGSLTEYAGGWSAYRLEKLSRAAGQGKDWQADRKRLDRLEALVRRFAEIARARPDPAWGKRLRARRSQLERERETATARPELGGAKMKVSFDSKGSKADYALILRGYRKAFGERVLLEGVDLDLMVGERAAIVGPNGSGKTSLIRDIVAAEGGWDGGGAIRVGPSMRIGYCAQEQEVFRGERTVEEEFRELGAKSDEAFRLLKRFLFERSVLEARISSLSGGERNRLQIARAVYLGANFLILDEPTNHLDIEGREALEEGLADFEGSILAVSHDRWFLEKVAERLILVEEGRLVAYEGSFAEYWRDLGSAWSTRKGSSIEGRVVAARAPARGPSPARNGRAGREDSAGDERRRGIEQRITEAEARKQELETASAKATGSRDYALAGRLARDAAELGRRLERLYGDWEAQC